MKITRYFQSCLLIEENGIRILFDPSGEEGDIEKFGKLGGVIYTHQHIDHFSPDLNQKFVEAGIPIYANDSTAEQMKTAPNIINDGQEFSVEGVKVKALELSHCPMVDGSAGPKNTGYLVSGKFFHPGDGKELGGLKVEILALPIAGPDISLRDASDFAKNLGAKVVVPIHYDSIGVKPEIFEILGKLSSTPPYEVRIISNGQSVEL